jgi:hypothetical protein
LKTDLGIWLPGLAINEEENEAHTERRRQRKLPPVLIDERERNQRRKDLTLIPFISG